MSSGQKRTVSHQTIETVTQMSKDGKTLEEIAEICELLPETVYDILAGEYSLIERRQVKPRRCPTCGALITTWPCVLCVQTSCSPLVPPKDTGQSHDSLSSSEEARYEEVKHWRDVYGSPAINPEHPLNRSTTEDKPKEGNS